MGACVGVHEQREVRVGAPHGAHSAKPLLPHTLFDPATMEDPLSARRTRTTFRIGLLAGCGGSETPLRCPVDGPQLLQSIMRLLQGAVVTDKALQVRHLFYCDRRNSFLLHLKTGATRLNVELVVKETLGGDLQAEPETQKKGERFVRGNRSRWSSTAATTEREASRMFGSSGGDAFLLDCENGSLQ